MRRRRRRLRRGVQTIEAGVAGVGARRGGERATTLDFAVARGRRREGGEAWAVLLVL